MKKVLTCCQLMKYLPVKLVHNVEGFTNEASVDMPSINALSTGETGSQLAEESSNDASVDMPSVKEISTGEVVDGQHSIEALCCIHTIYNKHSVSTPKKITNTTFKRLVGCTKLWQNLEGNYKEIADKLIAEKDILKNGLIYEEFIHNHPYFGYHKECYIRYINKRGIIQAENRMKRERKLILVSSDGQMESTHPETSNKWMKKSIEAVCCIHRVDGNSDIKEDPILLTAAGFRSLVRFTKLWKKLDGCLQELSDRVANELGLLDEGMTYFKLIQKHPSAGYHSECYDWYTDSRSLALAGLRKIELNNNTEINIENQSSDPHVNEVFGNEQSIDKQSAEDSSINESQLAKKFTNKESLDISSVNEPTTSESSSQFAEEFTKASVDMPPVNELSKSGAGAQFVEESTNEESVDISSVNEIKTGEVVDGQRSKEVECCVHTVDKTSVGTPKQLTRTRFHKLVSCTKSWQNLEGKYEEIAEKLIAEQDILKNGLVYEDFIQNHPYFGFHKICYKRYIDKSAITRFEKRMEKKRKLGLLSSDEQITGPEVSKKMKQSIEVVCCIHNDGISDIKESPIQLTATVFKKLVCCTRLWKKLDGALQEVSERVSKELGLLEEGMTYFILIHKHPSAGYHSECYDRYTDSKSLALAGLRLIESKNSKDTTVNNECTVKPQNNQPSASESTSSEQSEPATTLSIGEQFVNEACIDNILDEEPFEELSNEALNNDLSVEGLSSQNVTIGDPFNFKFTIFD